jgi:hypothetical protein
MFSRRSREDHASPVGAIKPGSHDQRRKYDRNHNRCTNQDAKRRLRESPCRTEATLMTFTLEGEGCAPQAAGKRSEYGCQSASGHECLFFLECLVVSTDDTATTAATAGNGDFGTSPFFGGSQAGHNLLVTTVVACRAPRRKGRIEKLGAELFTCRLSAFPRRALPRASFAQLPYMSANGPTRRLLRGSKMVAIGVMGTRHRSMG